MLSYMFSPRSLSSLNTSAQFLVSFVAVTFIAISGTSLAAGYVSGFTHLNLPPIVVNESNKLPVAIKTPTGNLFGLDGEVAIADNRPTKSSLDITLKGLFPSNDPNQSTAIISINGAEDKLLSIGNELMEGVVLTGIEKYRIIISKNNKEQFVSFKEAAISDSEELNPTRIAVAKTAINEPTLTNSFESFDKVKQRFQTDPFQTFKEIGLRITGDGLSVSSSSPLTKLGLKANDKIIQIDGTPVAQVLSNLQRLREIKERGSVRVTLVRNGSTITVNVAI